MEKMTTTVPMSAASAADGVFIREALSKGIRRAMMMAHPAPSPFGTVLRPINREPPDRDIRVMSLGTGTATPIAGYAHTDYVPIPIDPLLWEPVPEPKP